MHNPYSTHLPVLTELVKPNLNVIEFGCGEYSTPLFLQNCASLVSIEMQDEEWLHKVSALPAVRENRDLWYPKLAVGPWDFLSLRYEKYDLALIDGHKASRWACVALMMNLGVPLIVAHDTEAPKYGWDRVPLGYERTDHKELIPWTTVWRKTGAVSAGHPAHQ